MKIWKRLVLLKTKSTKSKKNKMTQYATRGEIEDLKARVEALEAKQKPKIEAPKSKPEIKE